VGLRVRGGFRSHEPGWLGQVHAGDGLGGGSTSTRTSPWWGRAAGGGRRFGGGEWLRAARGGHAVVFIRRWGDLHRQGRPSNGSGPCARTSVLSPGVLGGYVVMPMFMGRDGRADIFGPRESTAETWLKARRPWVLERLVGEELATDGLAPDGFIGRAHFVSSRKAVPRRPVSLRGRDASARSPGTSWWARCDALG